MSKGLNLSQQKVAEKIVILNERSVGILTRIYNIKKVWFDIFFFTLIFVFNVNFISLIFFIALCFTYVYIFYYEYSYFSL